MKRIGPLLLAVLICSLPSAGRASGWPDVPGRWTLRKATPGSCLLGFSGAPAIPHGTVSARGFCPQAFLGLPRWRLEAEGVVIIGRNGRRLAELAVGHTWAELAVGRDQLIGRTAAGEPILLER